VLQVQQQTTAQVAAYPAFIDDNRPTGGGGAVAAGPVELPPAQQQPQPQPRPPQQLQGGQQQQEQQQQRGWFAQTRWGSTPQQPQQQQARQQRQLQEQVHIDMAAALQVQQGQQQQQQQQEQQSSGDALISQLQQCADLASVAALVSCQQREQHLTLPQACAALQQLCRVAPVSTLTSRQQQQVQQCCAAAADSALQNLQQLGHTDLGQLLAMFQVLGFKPEGAWVRSVLQQAGTELVHYSPAELALLLLTATHASARCGVIPGPDAPVVQLLPSRRVPQPSSLDAFTASSTTARQQQQLQEQQQQQQRRANTVLTSAWLQHFLSTFQPYIACRSAHPQLSPGHMEAVITCLAALRVAPDRFWMYLFVRQMSAQLPTCSPGSVVRMLGALATLGYRLPDHVLLQVERQIGTAAAMVQLRAEECVEVVRSVAVLRAQLTKPSEAWLQQLLAAAVKGSRHLSASAVIGLLAGTAALGLQLDPSWMDVLMMQARAALSAMTPHEHVSLIDALSQQQHQYRPGPVFMSVYLSQVAAHLPELSISQQAVLATGLATVGYKPGSAWMAAFMMQLLAQPVTGADGEHLLQLLRALRRMQYVPAPNVAQQLSGLIDSIQLSVPYNQLLLLREALDELQYQRGIMAVPGGPRRAAEAAAAAAAAAVAAAPPSQAVEGAGGEAGSLEVAAVEGVMSAAATEKLLTRSAAGAAGFAEEAAQAGGRGGEALTAAALDAAAGRQVPAQAALSTAAAAAAAVDAAAGEQQGVDEAGSAAGDKAGTEQGMEGNNAGSSSSTTAPVGVAQQSLELFA